MGCVLKSVTFWVESLFAALVISSIGTHFSVVCLVLCLSETLMHFAQSIWWTWMPFGGYTVHLWGPVLHCVRWDPWPIAEGEICDWTPRENNAVPHCCCNLVNTKEKWCHHLPNYFDTFSLCYLLKLWVFSVFFYFLCHFSSFNVCTVWKDDFW